MNAETALWTEDWKQRLYASLGHLGYSSVLAYLADRPGEGYFRLARQLEGFAALQIQQLQWEEAQEGQLERRVAMDALVRIMRDRLRKGWGKGRHRDLNTAGVLADWLAMISGKYDTSDVGAKARRVWECLKESAPPGGWLPQSPEDLHVKTAFDRGWPEAS